MTSLFNNNNSVSQQQQQQPSAIRRKASHPTAKNHHSTNGNSAPPPRITPFTRGPHRSSSSSSSSSFVVSFYQRIPIQCIKWSCITMLCFQFLTLWPIFIYEGQQQQQQQRPPPNNNSNNSNNNNNNNNNNNPHQQQQQQQQQQQVIVPQTPFVAQKPLSQYPTHTTKDGRKIPIFTMSDLSTVYDESRVTTSLSLLRGIQQELLPPPSSSSSSIPEPLRGAQRAHIHCPELNVQSLAYWNDPIGTRDEQYTSPFSVYSTTAAAQQTDTNEMYISFTPDPGGWNNIRMSMEIIFVIAAATQRTLILPPKEPLYLLHHDAQQKHRGFADFFPIHTERFQKIVKTITFEDFLIKEGKVGPLSVTALQNDDRNRTLSTVIPTYEQLLSTADHCEKRKAAADNCVHVYNYLKLIGHTPDISASHTCLIFDELVYHDPEAELPGPIQEYIQLVCGEKRQVVYFNAHETSRHRVLHFQADRNEYRLLTHFYNMIHFTNPVHDHHYKRFVRDFLHYHDSIYCAAGKIVKALQLEAAVRTPSSYTPDPHGAGGYAALHVRRGDLQYKKVKISAAAWYNNTREVWKPHELLYIATDERDKSFFDDLAAHHTLRFLDDYWDMAGLSDLDPNYMGMIDTIVASRGRAFAGTWFSTFSGYINRLRGYHGMTMQDSWYSFLDRKTAVHEWKIVDDFVYAYEFPDGWMGIDFDTFPTRDKF